MQKLALEEIENLGVSLTTKEIDSIVKNFLMKIQGPHCFIGKVL